MDHVQAISICGETLNLLPEKLVEWPERQTLLAADMHFGKAATFRSMGIPVPEQTTFTMLECLSRVIVRTGTRRLIVLGDFIHSAIKNTASFELALIVWRDAFPDLEIVLVRGNHDRGRNDLFAKLAIRVVEEPYIEHPFAFCHYREACGDVPLYGIAGHLHPQIALSEGKKRLRLPCFWFGENQAVLPAFGAFTGCTTICPAPCDRLFVIADHAVVRIDHRTIMGTRKS
jgi:uncharacterized protein